MVIGPENIKIYIVQEKTCFGCNLVAPSICAIPSRIEACIGAIRVSVDTRSEILTVGPPLNISSISSALASKKAWYQAHFGI